MDSLTRAIDLTERAKLKKQKYCVDNTPHNFKLSLHMDGKDSYINYSECTSCTAVLREEHTRLRPWN